MRKAERHLLIKQLIQDSAIRTQEELLAALKNHGVAATQATISRDVRELKIVKVPDARGELRFELFNGQLDVEDREENQRLIQLIEEIVLKVERVHFMTIVNTLPDNAHLFASVLDDLQPEDMISTIAGFDTVVILSESDETAKRIEAYLKKYSTN